MTDRNTLTPRSQAVWSRELLDTAPDRATVARKAGLSRSMFSRMLSGASPVPADLARRLAELCGLVVVPRSLHGFTLEAQP